MRAQLVVIALAAAVGLTSAASTAAIPPPSLGDLRVSPERFREGSRATATFKLAGSVDTQTVQFLIERRVPGTRHSTGACVPSSRGTRGEPCAFWRHAREFSKTYAWDEPRRAVLPTRKLRPGRYRLTASCCGNVKHTRFSVVRRRD